MTEVKTANPIPASLLRTPWAPEIPLPLQSAALPPSPKPHSKSLTFLLLTPSLAVLIPILLLS